MAALEAAGGYTGGVTAAGGMLRPTDRPDGRCQTPAFVPEAFPSGHPLPPPGELGLAPLPDQGRVSVAPGRPGSGGGGSPGPLRRNGRGGPAEGRGSPPCLSALEPAVPRASPATLRSPGPASGSLPAGSRRPGCDRAPPGGGAAGPAAAEGSARTATPPPRRAVTAARPGPPRPASEGVAMATE